MTSFITTLINVATYPIDACVEGEYMKPRKVLTRRGFCSLVFGVSVLFVCLSDGKASQNINDLKSKLVQLQSEISSLSSTSDTELAQGTEIINAISAVIAPPLSTTVGTVASKPGVSIDLPVYFKAGSSPVSGIQFDVTASSGFVVTSVTPGIAALAANKNIQGNPVPGGFRAIVFGLNQTPIPSGPIAILKVKIASNVLPGKRFQPITNMSAASPEGNNVPLTGKNGAVIVR